MQHVDKNEKHIKEIDNYQEAGSKSNKWYKDA
jgi:hypothetical protein